MSTTMQEALMKAGLATEQSFEKLRHKEFQERQAYEQRKKESQRRASKPMKMPELTYPNLTGNAIADLVTHLFRPPTQKEMDGWKLNRKITDYIYDVAPSCIFQFNLGYGYVELLEALAKKGKCPDVHFIQDGLDEPEDGYWEASLQSKTVKVTKLGLTPYGALCRALEVVMDIDDPSLKEFYG